MKASLLFRFVTVLVVGTALRVLAAGSDFAQAVVVIPPGLSGPERKAATMLIEEVEKRSYQRWTLSEQEPASGPVVYLGQREIGRAHV